MTLLPDAVALVPVAAAALVRADGRVLVAERLPGTPLGGLWEFPGGKIDAGETPEAALVRELDEELGVTVAMADLEPAAFASHPLDVGHLVLLLYLVRRWSGDAVPRIGQRLRWVTVAELAGLAMPPADAPLVTALAARLQGPPATGLASPPLMPGEVEARPGSPAVSRPRSH